MDGGAIERWSAWVASAAGGVAMLAGVVSVARWAWQEGWLAGRPEIGLAVGLVIGTVGLVAAEALWERGERALAAGLSGSGLGIVYFALYAGHAWYDLLGANATSVALLAATGVGALQAVRRDSQLTAALGLVGGMATPLLLGRHAGPYLAYLLLLNGAVVAASVQKRWRVLPWLAIACTLTGGLAWVLWIDGATPTPVTVVAAAAIGAGWALIAAHPRVERRDGLPWLVGAAGGLTVSLGFVGTGGSPMIAVVIPLFAVSIQIALLLAGIGRYVESEAPETDAPEVLAVAGFWGIPWLLGATGGLLAALALVGVGVDPAVLVLVPVCGLAAQLTTMFADHAAASDAASAARLQRVIATAAGWSVALLGCLAMIWLSARWVDGEHASVAASLLLLLVPVSAATIAALRARVDPWMVVALWGGSVLAALWVGAHAPEPHGALLAVVISAMGGLLCFAPGGPVQQARATGPVGAASTLAATLALASDTEPVLVMIVGVLVACAALLPPLARRPPPERAMDWAASLAVPVLAAPMGFAWRGLAGPGADGVVPLLLAGIAAGGLAHLRASGSSPGRDTGAAALWAVVILLATIALPLQVEAQWLTLGWAVEGSALALLGARSRSKGFSIVGLLLLGTVTVRLVANPAVLDYHFVARPNLLSWVWYGYSIPAAALAAASRFAWLPGDVRPLRLGLELAAIAVGFVGANLLVSHGFAGGETLTLLDTVDAARVARTLSWTGFGVALIALPRGPRSLVGLGLVGLGALKLGAWDVWVVDGLARAIGLVGVALCLFLSAGLLGRRISGGPAAPQAPHGRGAPQAAAPSPPGAHACSLGGSAPQTPTGEERLAAAPSPPGAHAP